jgi:hypothetical protein
MPLTHDLFRWALRTLRWMLAGALADAHSVERLASPYREPEPASTSSS